MSQSQTDVWPQIRRVVTQHDSAGKATVWIDGAASNQKFPADTLRSTLIWVTDQNPDLFAATDDGQRIMGTAPPPGGTRCGVLDIAPATRCTDSTAPTRSTTACAFRASSRCCSTTRRSC